MTADRVESAPQSPYSSAYRLTTLGILILMTIIAFEAMAVATALPTAARSLNGLAAYGWCFTGFLVASVVGMVLSGLRSDLRGPRVPLLLGLILFIVGLIIGSAAFSMWVLIAARTLQGLAVGLVITAMYVVLGEVYTDEMRPRVFAALATAWVVPALVGPVIAGWLTEQLSWRWVFGGLAPFVALGGLMLWPSLRQLRSHAAGDKADHPLARPSRIGYAVLAAAGIAAIADLGQHLTLFAGGLAILGAIAAVIGLRRLLPNGAFRFRRGVPAAVAYRGVLAGTFFGMEAVVPLTLTVQHHYSPTLSGMPLMITGVTWALASQIQGRAKNPDRSRLVATGLVLTAVAGVGMALNALGVLPGWAAFVAWPIAGLGAGFALTSTSVVLLDFTNDADRGTDSSALQLADSSASALCTSFAGALVAAAAHQQLGYGPALAVVFITMAVLGLATIFWTRRLRPAAGVAGPVEAGAVGAGAVGAGAVGAGPVDGAHEALTVVDGTATRPAP